MAHFTSGGLSYEEKKTGALFGFLRQVFKLVDDFETHKIVFCWDSRKSYRKKIYPQYKERNEKLTDEELQDKKQFYSQITKLRQKVIPALGFKNSFITTGLEADDIIADLVMGSCNGGTVVSTDGDLWQLLNYCTIYNPRRKARFSKKEFENLWGINPTDWVKVKEIAGCGGNGQGDNVQGIVGIKEITAAKYIRGELPNGKIKNKIESKEGKKIITTNSPLVKLPFQSLNLKVDFNENFDLKDWIDVFREYNFKSFMNKSYLNKLKRTFNLTKAI